MLTNKEENRFIFPDEFQQNNGYLYGIILVIISLIILYKGVRIAGKKGTQEWKFWATNILVFNKSIEINIWPGHLRSIFCLNQKY